jgi:hypothetical protein
MVGDLSTARPAVTRRLASAIFFLVLAVFVLAAHSDRASARARGTVTAEYSGTQDFAYVYQSSDPSVWQQHGHFQWDEKLTVRPTPTGTVVVGGLEFTITGKIVSTYAPPNTSRSCTATFSARKNISMAQWPISILGVGDTANTDLSVSALIPATGTYAQSTGGPGTDCAVPVNGPAPVGQLPLNGPGDDFLITPLKDIRLGDLPWSKPYKIDYQVPLIDELTSVRATFTISGTGAWGPPKQPPTPARYRAKANAAQALKVTWERSLYPCIAAGAATPLLGLGPIGQAAAGVIELVAVPLCAAYEKTMAAESATINDPPLQSYDRTARVILPRLSRVSLPSCSRWGGAAHSMCQSLEIRLPRLLTAAQRTEAVAAAIETTISRETGAIRAHNASAVKQQDRTLAGLNTRFLTGERAETSAGAAVTSLLRADRIPLALTKAASVNAIAAVLRGLGSAGISRAALASVLGSSLNAHSVDWLRALK